jgi:nitrous oxide reductase accessory protein NosL
MKSTHLLAAALAAALLSSCGKKDDVTLPAPPPPASNTVNAPAPASTSETAFAKLPGKWLRPDGGYVLEIRSVDSNGNMDAGYFNPRPIHVANAVASQAGGIVKVFIELRDVNYPGSTYTLTYDPANDQLKGDYFQAAIKQNFDVFFTRVKP